ncbi:MULTISPECIES: helix-turn-helix transcriptional regulator [unclassified Crossiella]|uniref:helix-turn-helix domain-containing protein n=1 Tax=unclassified Crossiella TaxID=2620835 RepID=UPI001FFFFD4C|nr:MULTISPECIES: helix-turn-helix transcriptional regulator [unclassified Crossiella]MCK2243480.1 helix-turn-helix domain-containing protein [Crossiella sp. S99.2]MCK2257338.1 helix-turn-helix domain-containing protein [Crossiella sp. S99.1]
MDVRRAKFIRARKAAGFTQEALAVAMKVDRATVRRWESGEAEPLAYRRPRLASLLKVSLTVLEALLLEDDRDADVDRREFMGMAGGVVLNMATPMWPPPSLRAEERDCRHLLDRTARMRRLDNYLGGRDTYNLYATELASTVDYVRSASCTPAVHAKLVEVIAEQAQLAGWAAFDAGMHIEAKRHYDDSLRAAKQVENGALAGNALAFLAYQEISISKPNVELSEASFSAAKGDATPRVKALLLERKAWTHASAGDFQATEESLEKAKASLHHQDSRPEPDWVFWVDENEIDIMAGRCWAELRKPLRAVSVLENALGRVDDTHARDKALYMTSLADALIDAQEIERAVSVVQKSMTLAQGVGSVRPMNRINKTLQKLRIYKDSGPVVQLFEKLRT